MRIKKQIQEIKPSSKIKDIDIVETREGKKLITLISKDSLISLELDEPECYWLYRSIKKHLNLK